MSVSYLEQGDIVIGAHRAGEKVEKCFGFDFAVGALGVAVQEKLRDGVGDARVFKNAAVNYRALAHVGGNQDGRHANAEPVKRERHPGAGADWVEYHRRGQQGVAEG